MCLPVHMYIVSLCFVEPVPVIESQGSLPLTLNISEAQLSDVVLVITLERVGEVKVIVHVYTLIQLM